MAVVNIAFDLEPEIMEGLATGVYKIFGGVIRDQAGRIVRHLPEAQSVVAAAAEKTAASAAANATVKATAKASASKAVKTSVKTAPSIFGKIGIVAKAHPVGTTVTVVTLVAAAGYGIYRWVKHIRKKKAEYVAMPAFVVHFNTAMDNYYNAIREGTLNEAIVSDLMDAIDEMNKAVRNGTIKIEFTADQLNNMLGIFSYFTQEFAKANNYEYEEPEKPAQNDECGNLLYMKDYLKIQQRIYKTA